MAPVVTQSFTGAWDVPDSTPNPLPPGNHTLQISVSAISNGDWLIALIGWQQIGALPATVSVGDDAVNQWQPIITTPLDVSGTALNANSNFASGTTGWGIAGGTMSAATNETFGGNTQSVKIVPLGGSSTTVNFQSTGVACTVNEYFTASMWVYSPAGYASMQSFISWNNGVTFLSTNRSAVTVVPPGVWTQVIVSAPAPTNANLASVGLHVANNPQPWDVMYVGQGTMTMGNGFSANTRCTIWAAPNVRSSVTTVSIAPLGQVTAIAATVLDVTGMPTWLQANISASALAKASSVVSTSVTPTANSLVVEVGANDNHNYTLYRQRGGLGWPATVYTKSITNGVDLNGDVAVVGAVQVASSATTATFYGVDAINANPDFVSNITGWQAINGTLALSSLGFISAHSALLTPNGTSSAVTAQITHATAPAVSVGTFYLGDTYVQATGSTASVRVGLEWLTAGLATVSTTFSATVSVPADGTWYNLAVEAAAPATAAFASLHVEIDGTPPVTRKLNIAEGAITTVTNAAVDTVAAIAAFQLVPTSQPAQPNANWPRLRLEAAFGQAAETPPDQLVWTEISTRLLSVSTDRGRQYELNALEAGEASFVLRNDDGYLTPGSSLDPGLHVYTPFRLTALYSNRLYSVFQGYMERWPQTWADAHYGLVNAVGVDAWAMYTSTLGTVVHNERLVDAPILYWPCTDGAGQSSAVNIGVSSNQLPLVVKPSPFGAGASTTTFGDSSMNLAGLTDTNWICNGLTSTQANNGASLVYSGQPIAVGTGITISFYVNAFDTGPFTTGNSILCTVLGSSGPICAVEWEGTNGRLHILTWNVNTGVMTDHGPSAFGVGNGTDMMSLLITTSTVTLYVDNGFIVLNATDTLAPVVTSIVFNGRNDAFAIGQFANVAFSHIAVYNRILNTSRLLQMWFAADSALANEAGDFRISRLISYLQWATPQRIFTDPSVTTQVSGAIDIDGMDIGSAITNIVQTEQALLYVDRAGYLTYRIRSAALNRPTQAVLGENTAAGELPYRVTLELDYDPQYINNDIQITHVGNIPPGSSTPSSVDILVQDTGSINQYGDHSLQFNSYFGSVTESTNLANFLVSQYSQPQLRVAQVELIPGANPAQFATLLGLDIGDFITLNRRPIGAPLISLNVMIIGIHHDIEWGKGKWSVKLDLMPASIAALQIKTLKLNDAVLGTLDSGNTIGW